MVPSFVRSLVRSFVRSFLAARRKSRLQAKISASGENLGFTRKSRLQAKILDFQRKWRTIIPDVLYLSKVYYQPSRSRSFCELSWFSDAFESFPTCSELFGCVRTHSDAFECNRMHLSASGGIWTLLEISRHSGFFRRILMICGNCLTWGANYHNEIRVHGLIIAAAAAAA